MTRTGYNIQNGDAADYRGTPARRATRKCLDCPADITKSGGKLRCPECAILKLRRDKNAAAKAKRRAHKETA